MNTPGEPGTVIPASTDSSVTERNNRSIGTILIQAGRLTLEQAEQILRMQREKGLRFGDVAIQLALLTQADIDFALSRQFDYPYLVSSKSTVSDRVITAFDPFCQQARAISILRSRLMLRWFDSDPEHSALAIISSERNDGRSFIASNLAVTFSQLGKRTLLIDADMRNPSQHTLFGLSSIRRNTVGLSAVLAGRNSYESALHPILGLPDLIVMPAGAPPPNPLELLERPPFHQLLAKLKREFDVVLIDSPPGTVHADAQAIAARAGAAIIVVRKNASRSWAVRGVSEGATHASASVLGSVLNDY